LTNKCTKLYASVFTRWPLHVSAKQCYLQGAAGFLSEFAETCRGHRGNKEAYSLVHLLVNLYRLEVCLIRRATMKLLVVFSDSRAWCEWVTASLPRSLQGRHCGCNKQLRMEHMMTLRSTQPLTEMVSEGLTTLPPSRADCLEILGASSFCSGKGLSRPGMGYLYLYPMQQWMQDNTCRWQHSAGWKWSLVRPKNNETADENIRGYYDCALLNGHVANSNGILVRGLEIVNVKERRVWSIISMWIYHISAGCSTIRCDNYVYGRESALWFVHYIVI
jgi:hypothetical protein